MKSRLLVIMLLTGILAAAVVGLGAAGYLKAGTDRVIPGVKFCGVDLQGLNREKCMEILEHKEKKMLSTPVALKYEDKTWTFPLPEVDLRIDAQAMSDDALGLGREGSLLSQWQQKHLIKRDGYELPLRLVINKKKFEQKIVELTSGLGLPARDAAFRVTKDERIEIIPGGDGVEIDKEAAYRDLVDYLVKKKESPEIYLNLVQAKPRRTTEMVAAMGLKGLLGAYSTSFDPADVRRVYNIRVAASSLDGLLIPPGQEVSFNRVVGPRSTEAGYKNAKVIVNDEFVEGIGGGVCQVSTTLYNTILLSNLEILKRTNHSLPVSYVPIGRDATVVYGATDLKFRNSTESYVYVRSSVYGRQLNFKIYGNTDYKAPVSIRTRVIKVLEPKTIHAQDPNLKKGEQAIKQEGAKGYNVIAERVTWENGVAKVERLSESTYRPVNRIVAVGIKEEEEAPVILPPGVDDEQPPAEENPVEPVEPQPPSPGNGLPPVDNNEEKNTGG